MAAYVTRREEFSAAHRLFNPSFSDARNEEVFGKCNNPRGHGHNYIIEVTVAGQPDPETGMVIDLRKLSGIINDAVISKVDHRHLNEDVEFLRGVIPTAENLAEKFWELLRPRISDGTLCSVKLYESAQNAAEYRGEQ
jgi:6-pyruvoyltetrahydropterin/6-carboxytetrahydropterin synthase